MAEDTMNTLTEIIELRSSCQLVWQTLNKLESQREADANFLDLTQLENAVYFMSKVINLVDFLGKPPQGLLKEKDI